MKRALSALVTVAAVAVAAGSFLLVGAARAEDAPAGHAPQPQKKIDCAFAKAWVGDWDVTATMMGQESKAKSKVTLGIGDSALVEDYAGDMAGAPFAGHGIVKIGDDGKSVTMWWFDNFMADAIRFTGTLTDKQVEVSGTGPMGPMKIVMTQVEGGFDWTASMGEQAWMTQKYRKAR